MQKRAMNKLGVSAVVATVLIIMITVAAVGIIWAAIIPMVRENLGVGNVCKDMDVSIVTSQGYTCYVPGNITLVQVNKGNSNLSVSGLKFYLTSLGNSLEYQEDVSIYPNENNVFYLNTSEVSELEKISVVPIVQNGNSQTDCSSVSVKDVPLCSAGSVVIGNEYGQINPGKVINPSRGGRHGSNDGDEIPLADYVYTIFSNYLDNNATLSMGGIGWFNVTIANTNGTVLLEINNTNITATNLSSNVYNVSYNFVSNGTYSYRWISWGNGNNKNYNVSDTRNYVVNYTDIYYPQFSNYLDNNNTLFGSGIGWFNITVDNSNGTVLLEVNNTNVTATNLSVNVYNVSYNFVSNATYSYRWYSWGNGTNKNYNVSEARSYVVKVCVLDCSCAANTFIGENCSNGCGGNCPGTKEYGSGWIAKGSSRDWSSVAMSSNGSIQTAVAYNGQIYVSTDSGNTWVSKGSSRIWFGVAMSSNGTKQTAVAYGGQIYVSTDSGNTWIAKETNRNWAGVAMSSNSTIQTAVVGGIQSTGQIYVSTDSGNTWIAKETNRNWIGVAMSSNGTKQTAVAYGGQIYVSTDSGNTWTPKESNRLWSDVAMSSNSTIQTAVVGGLTWGETGQIYVSTDSGNTWIAKETNRNWVSVAMSADGKIQTAVNYHGQIYVSTDSGNTWIAKGLSIGGLSVAMSTDGKIQSAVPYTGNIYVSS